MSDTFPNSKIEITVIYQKTSLPQEIQSLPIHTKDIKDHSLAYSRFKSSVCRLFQLPKLTPFMLKDTLTGSKMTRDKFSEYLRSNKFPLVWVMITAVPGEEGTTKVALSQMDSCATTATTDSTDTLDLSPKQRSKSSSCMLDANSLHSIARTLSLGWNENTNTYGLETKCVQVPPNQLVFVSKRAPNLSLPVSQSSLSVGDLILKIEGRSVGEMDRDEIGLHLNYPLPNLNPLGLCVVTWTDAPQEVKDVISETMGYELDPIQKPEFKNERIPSTQSEPNFCAIPISSIDDPLSPDPINTPNTSPRKRKTRKPFFSESASDLLVTESRTSPTKKGGILTGPKPRNRALSSCSRSDSFSYIPSDPLSSCPVSESAVLSPPQAPEPSKIGLLADSAENIPKLLSVAMGTGQTISNPRPPATETQQPESAVEDKPQPPELPLDDNQMVFLVDSDPEVTLMPFNRRVCDKPELSEMSAVVQPEPREVSIDSLLETRGRPPDVKLKPRKVSADIKLVTREVSGDSKPELRSVPADTRLGPREVSIDSILESRGRPPDVKLKPREVSADSKYEPREKSADPTLSHPVIEPQLTLVPSDTYSSPSVHGRPPPLSVKYSRSISDPKAHRIFRAELSSSSSDMDTEDATGMYYVTDPPELEEYNLINHPFEPFDDTFEPHKPSKLPAKHSNSSKLSVEKLNHFSRFLSSHKSDTYGMCPPLPVVSDNNTTIVSSSCTEFVNPSFQGSVYGVYRSFNLNQQRRPPSKRRVSYLDTFDADAFQQTKSSNEIAYLGISSDESDCDDVTHFNTSRHRTGVPIGLITPVRPRKFAPDRGPDSRPVSETAILRSNSEASNLAANGFYEESPGGLNNRTRLMRKQKTMLLSAQPTDPIGYLESNSVSNGAKGEGKSSLYSGKPAEFIHPAYRPYQSFGNMEISEKMCLKLRDKFQPISCGPLSRKHEFDGRSRRRAADRSWKNLFVQLHNSDLIFYRSECGYLQDKPFLKWLTRDRTDHSFQYDHIVSLHHAKLYIPNDYMAHKRNTTSYVFRLETENTSMYLIRAVSLPLMFGWILSFMEARNLPPTDHPDSTGLFQDLEKRRRNTIEGANRYLSRLQQKMKSKLFTRRDSEVLFEPIFATSITKCARARENEKVPLLVEMCVKEIEERALESDGIYRVSGTARHIKSLRDDMSRGVEVEPEDERWADQNNIAGLLKLFFKELSEPLVSSDLYNSLIGTVNKEKTSQGQLIKEIQKLVQTMPDANLNTLDYVVAHLCRVAQYSSKNRMSIKNLAIVFGPTLITRRDLTSIELISQTNSQVCIMELLIVHYDHVFNCKPIADMLFDSRRCPSSISNHSLIRASKNSSSGFPGDRTRRVSSTEPPTPSKTPPLPYPDIHVSLESKLSRSWSEEVLTSASLIGESFGSDIFRNTPLNSLNTSSTLPRGISQFQQNSFEEKIPHQLSNTLWHIPLDNITPSIIRRDQSDRQRNPTFF